MEVRQIKGIITSLVAMTIAQVLKVPFSRHKTGKWDWKESLTAGGMPSSHAAGVTSLATYTGLKLGSKTLDFALSVLFGLIVMYDAQGVRKSAGETAIKVNELERRIDQMSGNEKEKLHDEKTKMLKEKIGHQPEEVLGGFILGFLVGFLSYLIQLRKEKRSM